MQYCKPLIILFAMVPIYEYALTLKNFFKVTVGLLCQNFLNFAIFYGTSYFSRIYPESDDCNCCLCKAIKILKYHSKTFRLIILSCRFLAIKSKIGCLIRGFCNFFKNQLIRRQQNFLCLIIYLFVCMFFFL